MQADFKADSPNRIPCQRETIGRTKENVRLFVPPETRRRIAALIDVHDRTLREVSRLTGYTERECLDIYRQWKSLEIRKQTAQAYAAGRMNPLPPIASARAKAAA